MMNRYERSFYRFWKGFDRKASVHGISSWVFWDPQMDIRIFDGTKCLCQDFPKRKQFHWPYFMQGRLAFDSCSIVLYLNKITIVGFIA